jgi:hypothetical protein
MAAQPFRVEEAFGDAASVDEDPFAARPRMPRSRWIGVAVALGGALILTWLSLARDPHVAAPPPSVTRTRPSLPESDTTASRAVHAPSDMSNGLSAAPVFRVQPTLKDTAESEAKLADTQREKVARRGSKPHAPKRPATSKDAPKQPKRQAAGPEATGTARLDRSGSDTRSGLALPAADLSRQDF